MSSPCRENACFGGDLNAIESYADGLNIVVGLDT